jgi:hypothetical protein
MGPRQLELPPNMPVIGVIARQRANAEGAEEFVFVEHLGQHAAEPGLVENGTQPPAGYAGFPGVVDAGQQFGTGIEKPLQTLAELRILDDKGPVKHGGRAQGQQANHRPDF